MSGKEDISWEPRKFYFLESTESTPRVADINELAPSEFYDLIMIFSPNNPRLRREREEKHVTGTFITSQINNLNGFRYIGPNRPEIYVASCNVARQEEFTESPRGVLG